MINDSKSNYNGKSFNSRSIKLLTFSSSFQPLNSPQL